MLALLSFQPQPERPQFAQSSIVTLVAEGVPMRYTGVPDPVTLSENWTQTESFAHELLAALPRIQMRYGTPASAANVMSK